MENQIECGERLNMPKNFEEFPFLTDFKGSSSADIIQRLSSQMTLRRKQRIESVLNQRSLILAPVLENIYDCGNIAAVMRSAEAFGFFNFHIIESIKNSKDSAQRVTRGADKWLEIQKWSSIQKGLSFLKSQGYRIMTTSLTEGAQSIYEVDFESPVALVFGNEKDGVSQEAQDMAEASVQIPIKGFTQSFNISVAAALCFQEASKKSRPLSPVLKERLKASYYLRSAGL